ncbi:MULTISPECIES: alginate O-acetyltransferase AlgF [Xanthomonas translucens group]|uniref:alginate O-acetyltransferase AlgF n=1 Tax=Xanthomonas translucens group TaxID=3390202 RepID=UPI00057912FB|nr:alginate O-acetyltransferase AlgF [Xanthomonas translucens]UII64761.1 alginate O-acetyltransferase AlgF [Xanthomonas translucens]UKE46630.1 alginate O-acetyltransferase AlgF [Xanthomonas translucens pv. cerealis]UKE68972.1 alginate O-acetyltransferase AlgF [Xanthomonas translucens pv. pistacia]
MKLMLAMRAATALAPLAASAQQSAAEGRLAQLYAARPPAGAAFVRVLNPGNAELKVGIGNGAAQRIGPATRATRYAIVEGGKPFAVRVAGTARAQAQVAAGSFTTLVLDPAVAAGASSARAINPVKARLVAACGSKDSAPLALQPGDHYSLFLSGSGNAPVLQGRLSGTDPVGR